MSKALKAAIEANDAEAARKAIALYVADPR